MRALKSAVILVSIGAAEGEGGGAHLSFSHPPHVGLLPDPRWLALACIAVMLGILFGLVLSKTLSGGSSARLDRRPR